MRECPFCPEAWPYVGLTLLLILCLGLWNPWFTLPAVVLLLFFLWFFRNPVRSFESDQTALLSPCDAQVMSIESIQDPAIGEAIKITMFLSVFNVHVNRTPLDARVVEIDYKEGKMLPAYKPHAAEENERNRILWETKDGFRFATHQITGILARRIVSDVHPNDSLIQGQRFGMIKFGSCTELILPVGTQILVQPGDKVRGVRSILARRVLPTDPSTDQ